MLFRFPGKHRILYTLGCCIRLSKKLRWTSISVTISCVTGLLCIGLRPKSPCHKLSHSTDVLLLGTGPYTPIPSSSIYTSVLAKSLQPIPSSKRLLDHLWCTHCIAVCYCTIDPSGILNWLGVFTVCKSYICAVVCVRKKTIPQYKVFCCRTVGQKKRLYEDRMSRQKQQQQQRVTVVNGSSSPGQWTRQKPRVKPGSLIQKLLDTFDSPRLRNS